MGESEPVHRNKDRPRPTPRRDDDEPALPDTTRDERDVEWGDEPGERDAEWYRRERPPHHE